MLTRKFGMLSVFYAALSLSMWGCGAPADTPQPDEHMHDEHDGHDHEGHDHAAMGDPDEIDDATLAEQAAKIEAALASLSVEDRATAMAQKVCLFSGSKLGSMGAPIKVSLNGTEAWICCEDCREEVADNPEKYLAKLQELLGPSL